jgi:hypothetical protein
MRIRRSRTRRRRGSELVLDVRTALWFARRLWRPLLGIGVEAVRLPRRRLAKR